MTDTKHITDTIDEHESDMGITETKDTQKKSKGTKGGAAVANRMMVGAAGAVAGAAIGSLAAIVLSDREMREKATSIMEDLPQKTNDTLDMLEKKTDEMSRTAKSGIQQTKKLTQKN